MIKRVFREFLKLWPLAYGGQFALILGLINIFDGWRKTGVVKWTPVDIGYVSFGTVLLACALVWAYRRALAH